MATYLVTELSSGKVTQYNWTAGARGICGLAAAEGRPPTDSNKSDKGADDSNESNQTIESSPQIYSNISKTKLFRDQDTFCFKKDPGNYESVGIDLHANSFFISSLVEVQEFPVETLTIKSPDHETIKSAYANGDTFEISMVRSRILHKIKKVLTISQRDEVVIEISPSYCKN